MKRPAPEVVGSLEVVRKREETGKRETRKENETMLVVHEEGKEPRKREHAKQAPKKRTPIHF
jgi:hypothetical protein